MTLRTPRILCPDSQSGRHEPIRLLTPSNPIVDNITLCRSPCFPSLTHLQFLVLGVLRNDPQPGRTLRKALSGYGIRRTGPAFYQLMARMEKERLVDGWYEQITVAIRRSPNGTTASRPKARGDGTKRARSTSTSRAPPRNCGGPMPEFRRGWARFLPREAERDLFHPSLEDLRADGPRGLRLQIAIARCGWTAGGCGCSTLDPR